jgi:predicted outer membrane repeat protein
MSFTHWLSNYRSLSFQPASRRKTPAARRSAGPRLECLEDRVVLSTLTVLNQRDKGAGSLRADIAAAHSGDTIVFAPSLDGQTITLTGGELLIKKNLTIAGPGAGELTVSGGGLSRVFEVANKENVTLSGLTISNGVSGIVNFGTLTVSNSTLSANTSYEGGGIDNEGTLTVSGSTLSGNVASYGGGIFNSGTLSISASILSGNTAYEYGGGIWNDPNGATVAVSGSTLSGNVATNGGGIYNEGTLTVVAGTLSGNTAGFNGGGIYSQGTLTVSGSTLSGNVASNGGGGILNIGILTVKNTSTITGNTAPVGSGADVYNQRGLYLDSSSTISILDGNPAVRI